MLGALTVVAALVGIGQLLGPQEQEPNGEAPAGQSLPTEPFERFDGTAGRLADYRGRPLVINFWASWCPPCVAEMPDFESVHQKLGGSVAFLGVNFTDEQAAAEALARRTGVTYDLARDADGRLFKAMGGSSMPATFFVSADGRIVDRYSGPLSRSQLERLVAETVAR